MSKRDGHDSYKWNQDERKALCEQTKAAVEAITQGSDSNRLELIKLNLDAWKTVVGVQMHFNDLEMRIRNFAVTVFLAVAGAAGLAFKEEMTVAGVPLSVGLMLLGALSWVLFLMMDRHWYHRLLLGAVYHGAAVEQGLREVVPATALSATIKFESPAQLLGSDYAVHSETKVSIFYGSGIVLMLLIALGLYCAELPTRAQSEATAAQTLAVRVAGPHG
jgi:hypothetical protein